MKMFFAASLMTVLASTAFATGGDQYKLVLNCSPAEAHPDMGMSLQVLEGGIAGMTTIRIERFFLGHHRVENYFVKHLPVDSQPVGSPLIYEGQDISLSINFTTTPPADGKRLASLITKDSGEETLKCEVHN